jgi:hypothetical protein
MNRQFPVLLLGILAAGSRPAAAQLQVTGIRNLAFGTVIAGIPSQVTPTDPSRSGQFEIILPANSTVRLNFTLPSVLNGPSAATMPISFGASDALIVGTDPGSVPTTINMKSNKKYTLTSSRNEIFLGGTVSPAASQPAGNYSATITLTVTIQ